ETNDTRPAANAARSDTCWAGVSNMAALAPAPALARLEQRPDRLFELGRRRVADEPLHNVPLRIDDERGGNSDHAPVGVRGLLVRDQDWIVEVDLVLLRVGSNVMRATRVYGKSHDREALVPVLALHRDEIGELLPARGAPGCPEIEDDDLAGEIGDVDRFPVEILERELRSGGADRSHSSAARL